VTNLQHFRFLTFSIDVQRAGAFPAQNVSLTAIAKPLADGLSLMLVTLLRAHTLLPRHSSQHRYIFDSNI
jgi:hypothetical protein